jgi:PAS domain S-box-containing protein
MVGILRRSQHPGGESLIDDNDQETLASSEIEHDEELLFRTLLETIHDSVVVSKQDFSTREWRVVYVNPALTRQIGYEAHEVVGQPPEVWEPILAGYSIDELTEALENDEQITADFEVVRKGGGKIWLEVIVTPVLTQSALYAVGVGREITGRKKTERKLQETVSRFEQSRRVVPETLTTCSYCQRVQDESERWMSLQVFLRARGPRFSHGVCPDCYEVISSMEFPKI